MDSYKLGFIERLLSTGSLRVGGDFTLKSKRISPWFVNIGDFNDGESSQALGEFYSDALAGSGIEFDILYGIPEKGNALAVSAAISLADKGRNVPWFFTRKVPKEYGESSHLSAAEMRKALVVGRSPSDGQAIAQLDDVFTAGNAKYEAHGLLKSMGDFRLPVLAIAVDRQEVGLDSTNAIEEYERSTGTKVLSIISATDVYDYLKERVPFTTPSGEITSSHLERMADYLRVYGTHDAKQGLNRLEQDIIKPNRSIIPACDVETIERLSALVQATADVDGVGAYKIGFELGLTYGLARVVGTIREHTQKPVIYDHQKAGTDIPDTGKAFARVCKQAGVDAVILFPQAGPETERAWIYHALDQGLGVIVGGRMTHPAYAASEGGFVTDEGALQMYRIAASAGINDFVVPGNKPEVIKQIRRVVEEEGADPIFYAPGFVAQGGALSQAALEAGNRFHGIVGRGIYRADDMRKAALEHTVNLRA
ncbi:MAG: orotidine 5'-phosphate decarboxylase / HUMPS family protein [Nanoarchaeota archaeon]